MGAARRHGPCAACERPAPELQKGLKARLITHVISLRVPDLYPATAPRRGAWNLTRRWLAALCSCAWLAQPQPAAAETETVASELHKSDAILVGSSSFNQAFGRIIERELSRRGYQVTRRGVSGAGLARPDFQDMSQVLEALPIGKSTAAVFVYLGVNDAQAAWLYPHERAESGPESVPFGTEAWDSVYSGRARDFFERICQRGAQRAIVLLPVDVERFSLQHHLEHIRDLQARAAAQTSCAVVLRTSGDAGQFDDAGVPKRLPDGFHMSTRGAQIVWARIQPEVLRLLSLGPTR